MDVSYFAKEVPSTPIHLANGRKIIFDSVDGITGYTLSADPGIIAQLDNCIRSSIGGVRRASQAEYEDFAAKKKPLGSNKPKQWREELDAQSVQRPGAIAVAHVAVDGNATAPKLVEAPKPAVPAEPQQPFKPKTVKRKT